MLLGTLFAFVKNLLFFQVLVVPWVVLFIAAFVCTYWIHVIAQTHSVSFNCDME